MSSLLFGSLSLLYFTACLLLFLLDALSLYCTHLNTLLCFAFVSCVLWFSRMFLFLLCFLLTLLHFLSLSCIPNLFAHVACFLPLTQSSCLLLSVFLLVLFPVLCDCLPVLAWALAKPCYPHICLASPLHPLSSILPHTPLSPAWFFLIFIFSHYPPHLHSLCLWLAFHLYNLFPGILSFSFP